jgi:hypothetical protein
MNPNPNKQRTFKVELAGDIFREKMYPKIRLTMAASTLVIGATS